MNISRNVLIETYSMVELVRDVCHLGINLMIEATDYADYLVYICPVDRQEFTLKIKENMPKKEIVTWIKQNTRISLKKKEGLVVWISKYYAPFVEENCITDDAVYLWIKDWKISNGEGSFTRTPALHQYRKCGILDHFGCTEKFPCYQLIYDQVECIL